MSTATALAFRVQSIASRDELIVEHMPLVNTIASYVQRSVPVHVELDDLRHAGMLGLIDAAEKFQAGKDVAFASYAKHRIRGAILDSMRRSDWVSRDLRKRYKQVEAARQALAAKLHREATDEEVAAELNINAEEWNEWMVDFRAIHSAKAQLRTEREDERPAQDMPCAPADSPEHVFARSEMTDRLNKALHVLPKRYQEVVTAYYHRDLTMREIAEELGVRESRVSQIHKAALGLMHKALAQHGIETASALAA
jgi:RNA polymerase sigma factor for flagellar operon FliA